MDYTKTTEGLTRGAMIGTMKLWILRPIALPAADTVAGFIIRAETELSARRFASEEPGAEGGFVWLDPKLSTCVELTAEGGDAGIVAAEFSPGD